MADDAAQLRAENAQLREQLQALQRSFDALEAESSARIRALVDENELLAEANRLLEENAALAAKLLPAPVEPALSQIPDALLLPGGGLANSARAALENVHEVGNLLSVAAPVDRRHVAVTGGVDKHVAVHDWAQQRKLCAYAASGPVLDIAFNPNPRYSAFFVATFMDAKHALLRLVETDGAWAIEPVALFHDHARPGAMRAAWSSTGELFATASCDKSVHLYQCQGLDGLATCEKIKSYYFNGIAEALTFVPPSADGALNEQLVIAVREDCYVHYVDCMTFEKERVNMNQDGIEHVSYTIMDLRVSPSGKYLLAATDKDRHFIFSVKSNVVYRNLYGHKAGPYSQPRAVWHPSEKYVISNTEENGKLFVWCIASERVIEQIDAHEKLVRGIFVTPTADATDGAVVLTVSYDKRLKAWASKELGSSLVL